MTQVRGKALKVIYELVSTTDTKTAICERVGISRNTLNRWEKDPVWQAKYQDVFAEFESDIREIPFASKKRRLSERQRLYDTTPDQGEERWHNGEIKCVKVNSDVKSKILNDIKDELEGRKLALTDPDGSPLGSNLLDARRQAAKDLEDWEKAQEDQGDGSA